MPEVSLRQATADDIPFIMASERLPVVAPFVSHWDEARHRTGIEGRDMAYLIGGRGGDEPEGFAMLGDLRERNGNVCLYRIVAVHPGSGFGAPFLAAVVDWAFRETTVHRLWLDVVTGNERARHVYEKAGFVFEGVLRQSYIATTGQREDLAIMSMLRPEWEARGG